MEPAKLFYFIDKGAHIAHGGKLIPTHAWKIDKIKDTPKLKKDGSNFFQIATQIK